MNACQSVSHFLPSKPCCNITPTFKARLPLPMGTSLVMVRHPRIELDFLCVI